MQSSKINLSILTRSLGSGGAERQLIELVKRIDPEKFAISIFFFYSEGELLAELADIQNIDIIYLSKKSRWDFLGFIHKLNKQIRNKRSDILYGYLDVPNIFALFAGKMTRVKIAFGLRSSHVDFSLYDWTASIVYRLEALLSHYSDLVIINSKTGFDYHRNNGFAHEKIRVIPNGIDTKRFRPDLQLREKTRLEWGIYEKHFLVGIVGRLDPIKGHATFLQMAAILVREYSQVRFVCVGDGTKTNKAEIRTAANGLGLGSDLVWAGNRTDMPAVYSALDVLVSASYGEGFSNMICEAMSCEVPSVVTDVGDSAIIVGKTGKVVAPKDPQRMAGAVLELLMMSNDERANLGCQARKRIKSNYSLEKMVSSTENLFTELVGPSK